MTQVPIDILHGWVERQLPEAPRHWLDEQLAKLGSDPSVRDLHIALGMVPRRLGWFCRTLEQHPIWQEAIRRRDRDARAVD